MSSETIAEDAVQLTSTYRSSRSEVFYYKMLLETLQYSQGNTCARVSLLIKLQARGLQI